MTTHLLNKCKVLTFRHVLMHDLEFLERNGGDNDDWVRALNADGGDADHVVAADTYWGSDFLALLL